MSWALPETRAPRAKRKLRGSYDQDIDHSVSGYLMDRPNAIVKPNATMKERICTKLVIRTFMS